MLFQDLNIDYFFSPAFNVAITVLKKGAHLLKYGRRGKPKFCPFRLSNDESLLIWHSGKEERHLKLSTVSRIIPGQRTATFQRYPRPEKEYQSFSLICSDRSLDLICKDKDEAEVWFVGLNALISRGSYRKWISGAKWENSSSDGTHSHARRNSPSDHGESQLSQASSESTNQSGFGKVFSDIISYTATAKSHSQADTVADSLSTLTSSVIDTAGRSSAAENFRVSLSSAVSSSSQGSVHEDFDSLGDVFLWGEGIGDGILGGGTDREGGSPTTKMGSLLPKALESTVVLDVHNIACGSKHAVLVTKQGEIFSWGEEAGGRLGHGIDADVSHPKLIDSLSGLNVELVACGEYHTCAVTISGDLYTWGDGIYNSGLLGHGSGLSHWIPRKVGGALENIHVSYISCGPWHTAAVTSAGQLFTFGDGTFGALGHGDKCSTSVPREVETLRGLRTVRVACGVWHTAAVVEVIAAGSGSGSGVSGGFSSGKLFTWGDGDKGQLGHGDIKPRLVPESVAALADVSFSKVVCGHNLTVALTTLGRVYTMGSKVHGQLGRPGADGMFPTCIEGTLGESFVEEIACGSHHVAVLTSKAEVYTWGKGANGQLGHGDNDDKNIPSLVLNLKDKKVRSVVCGSNFTAVICLNNSVSTADQSACSGCHNPFGFRRKRHNCYNCGLVFCKACSSRKSLKASLAPDINKPYRVCDDCYVKLKKAMESGSRMPSIRIGNIRNSPTEAAEKSTAEPKLCGNISRLSSSVESINQESRRKNMSFEINDGHTSPVQTDNFQWGNFHSLKPSNALVMNSKKNISVSVPASRMVSRATSPISRKSSPPRPPTSPASLTVPTSFEVVKDSWTTNDQLRQEVVQLRAQVQDLSSKSQLLEAELERTSGQLKDISAIAASEKEKCKAAKEVIKSLTAQLKEMAAKIPGNASGSESDSVTKMSSNVLIPVSDENNTATLDSPEGDTNGSSLNPNLSNGIRTRSEGAECVVQDEPGVYLTLCFLPGVGIDLKRVRFSRRRFSEEQAEKWWAENKAKVYERHNIVSTDKNVHGGAPS
ncbi:Brevis radix (BRX) domain [Dillenia turbinata]|uniref:Brevis radix (BRX) domain n=1 Tax=Dillenia turbinata TaxID=194707 RepID=A0AAN8ZDU1_9MAGN